MTTLSFRVVKRSIVGSDNNKAGRGDAGTPRLRKTVMGRHKHTHNAYTHSRKECTSRGHHQSEHDGEATAMVQLKKIYASATDLSKYFTSD